MDGKVLCGSRIRVELSTGMSRKTRYGRPSRRHFDPNDRCYQCGERGHYAYDCYRYNNKRGGRRSRFRDPALSEAELCALMQDFVSAARAGAHREQGWPSSAYATSKLGLTVLTRVQARQLSQDRPGDGILLNAGDPGWVRTNMAGPNAPKSPEEGAQTLLYLALLPPGATAPHGELVSEKKVQEW
ncbi:UNVERIFIED_CONTAM: hypothetical protein FKN15_005673 [Acipenser sinensis]